MTIFLKYMGKYNLTGIEWSLFLLFSIFLPFQLFTFYFGGRSVYACDFLFFLLAFVWLGKKALLREQPVNLRSPVIILLGLYLLSCICSTMFSTDFRVSAVSLVGKFQLALTAVIAMDVISTEQRVRTLLRVLASVFAVVLLSGLAGLALYYSRCGWNPFIWSDHGQLGTGDYPRLTGVFNTPQELGLYLSMGIFWVFAYFTSSGHMRLRNIVLLALVFFPVVLFCLSRDLFGIFTGFFTYILLAWIYLKRFCGLAIFLSGGVVFGLFFVFFLSTIVCITPLKLKLHATGMIPEKEYDFVIPGGALEDKHGFIDEALLSINLHKHDKMLYFEDMCKVLAERPYTGKGIGVAGSTNNMLGVPRDMHNAYWQVLVQQGWPGLIFLMIALILLFYQGTRGLAFSHPQMLGSYLWFLAAAGAFLGSAYFNHHANNRIIWYTAGVILGLHAVLFRKDKTNAENT